MTVAAYDARFADAKEESGAVDTINETAATTISACRNVAWIAW